MPQRLRLAGEIAGTAAAAYLTDSPTAVCTKPARGEHWRLPDFDLAVAGRAYQLT
ncbi:MAG: hypothetical protein ACREPA_10195 [Candidatus Dormibacteraceae bacterium]